MIKRITWLAAVCAGMVAGFAQAAMPPMTLDGARWVWFPEGNPAMDAPIEARYFRKTIDIPAGPSVVRARMLVTADNAYTAWVNGKQVAASDQLRIVPTIDVTAAMRAGKNVIGVEARNIFGAQWAGKNPAGLVAKVSIELSDGTAVTVQTDGTWKALQKVPADWNAANFDDSGWPNAKELGGVGDAPWGAIGPVAPAVIPENFPRFIVPGHDEEMATLRRLFWHHYQNAQPLIPLWDEWMTISTLWPAMDGSMGQRWAGALAGRIIDAEGYVACQQHDGTGHSGGWPFPLWHQGQGIGWHFAPIGVSGYEPPLSKGEGWTFAGIKAGAIGGNGWELELTDAHAAMSPPKMAVGVLHAPFIRINWRASGLGEAKPYLEWTTKEKPEFSEDRRAYFAAAPSIDGESRTMIATYKLPAWKGVITGLRVNFDNPAGAKVILKSLHTAYDTRQTVNNPNYIVGCCNEFNWTGDVEFLRANIVRIRKAMNFAMTEFDTRNRKCVYTPWVGHDGLTGVGVDAAGNKEIRFGHGIGGDYWDILPFGHEDIIATIYYYHAVKVLADLEEQIAAHADWKVSQDGAFDPADLRAHAAEVKAYAGQKFWIEKTGRFGSGVDLNGASHDYGFTFVNCEAIYYDFATKEQAESIESWMSGERVVAEDTAKGEDIYHWRFGPRSTTRRNLDWYFWGWSSPESIGWGDQVQDGGAVLGFSYFDMMARIKTRGPDSAEPRLAEICKWFEETESAGGYRSYYSTPGHGSMQGGNVAGGLGLDKEFFESVLVPQVMLYGFIGFRPTADGFAVEPKLPKDWPSLTVTGIRLRGQVMDVTVEKEKVSVKWINDGKAPMAISTPWRTVTAKTLAGSETVVSP